MFEDYFAGYRILAMVHKGKMLPSGINVTKTPTWPFGASYTTEPIGKTDVGLLIEVIDPN